MMWSYGGFKPNIVADGVNLNWTGIVLNVDLSEYPRPINGLKQNPK